MVDHASASSGRSKPLTRPHRGGASSAAPSAMTASPRSSGSSCSSLLAVEGATIPSIRPLLSVHIFVGMLLLGPVALKLASTGYRFVRYYTGGPEYVRLGPPAPLMRLLVAPVLVLSTLDAVRRPAWRYSPSPHRGGASLGLHKASFIVWFGAMSIHVLAYVLKIPRLVSADVRPDDSLGGSSPAARTRRGFDRRRRDPRRRDVAERDGVAALDADLASRRYRARRRSRRAAWRRTRAARPGPPRRPAPRASRRRRRRRARRRRAACAGVEMPKPA